MTVELYAKSFCRSGPKPPTVEEHCREVCAMASAILDEVGGDLETALARPLSEFHGRLRPLLLTSAWLHDFMKANSSFQEMLTAGADRRTQPVRHEILAAIQLTQNKALRDRLSTVLSPEEIEMIAWAIGGHHFQLRLKREREAQNPLFRVENVPRRVTLYLDHPQVTSIVGAVQHLLCEQGSEHTPDPLPAHSPYDPLDEDDPDGLAEAVRRFVLDSDREWKRWQTPEMLESRIALGLLKVLLVAADIAGSTLPQEAKVPAEWVRENLQKSLNENDLSAIVQANLCGRPARKFQEAVALSDEHVTVVAAGCGNGKTTAAYMWAKKWAADRKLFFTYPTTGTASAGFRDYLFAQSQLERDLIHGRSSVDLEAMWESSSDVPPIERAQRLEALNAWGQQAIACTADTVLGLIQNQRRPVFSFPAILRGAFVFDEVHSYDRRMFAALLRFLKTFPGLPVLIMSASIPPDRLAYLRRVAGDRMNSEPIRGDQKLERVKRYALHSAPQDECWSQVSKLVQAQEDRKASKVLWVCNTVGTAVRTFREARNRFPDVTILLYHSRYRYRDRVVLQEQIIDEFAYADDAKSVRRHVRPAIAITTQVCEISLDISADILVSALCPLPSLVQRLGRLNRYADTDAPCRAYIYPFVGRPYHEEDASAYLTAAAALIDGLNGEPCSQEMLSEAIDNLQSNEELPEYSAWLDGGWQTEPMPVREGDNSITLVREEDLANLAPSRFGDYSKEAVIPLTIPMLFQRGFDFTRRAASYPVSTAGTVAYGWDETTKQGEGASWASGM